MLSRRTILSRRGLAAAGFVIVLAWLFFGQRSITLPDLWHFIGLLTREFALLIPFVAAVFGLGTFSLRLLGIRPEANPGFFPYALGLGMGVLSLLVFAFGAAGVLFLPAGWGLLGVGTVLGLVELLKNRSIYAGLWGKLIQPRRLDWFSLLLGLFLILNLAYPLLGDALLPPTNWDEVAYHLAIPKIYLQNHRIVSLPFMLQSNWPLGAEMLFMLGLLFSSETLAHMVSWFALLVICLAIFRLGERYFGYKTGLLAAVIFSATPMVGALAGVALVELPLTLYTTLAVFAFLGWVEEGERSNWVLSAIFGGLVAGTKLNGAATPAALGAFLLAASLMRHPIRPARAFTHFGLFGLIALAVVSPWYIKAWIQTGNPVWPLFMNIFGGRNWDALGTEYLFQFIRLPNMLHTFKNWALGLWELTVHAVNFGGFRIELGWQYLVLLPFSLPLIAFSKERTRRFTIWLGLFGLVFYTVWFLSTNQTRFLMPVTPVWALLGAAGTAWLWGVLPQGRSGLQAVVVVFLLATSWFASENDLDYLRGRWPFLSGQIGRQEFLSQNVQGYETFRFANETLPADAKVFLGLWEVRGYFLDRDYAWGNPIGQRVLRFETFSGPDQLAETLSAQGFTYVISNRRLLEELTFIRHGPEISGLFQDFLDRDATLLFADQKVELYALSP